MTKSKRFMGLDFADLSAAGAAALIVAQPPDRPFRYVVTPNADHIVRLARQPSLRPLYQQAWLTLMDSRFVATLSQALRLPTPPVVAGSDLTRLLLAERVTKEERITIIGMTSLHVALLAARAGLAAPAHYNPPMGFERDAAEMQRAVDFVLAHPARLVFLAVGSPRQEQLAAAIVAAGGATGIGLCVGASLEFAAGVQKRAPEFLQRRGLEWTFRLIMDPRGKARRYLVQDPPILGLLLRERLRTAGWRA